MNEFLDFTPHPSHPPPTLEAMEFIVRRLFFLYKGPEANREKKKEQQQQQQQQQQGNNKGGGGLGGWVGGWDNKLLLRRINN